MFTHVHLSIYLSIYILFTSFMGTIHLLFYCRSSYCNLPDSKTSSSTSCPTCSRQAWMMYNEGKKMLKIVVA